MIVDSSVLIHLARIGELELLREFGEVKITRDVYREAFEEQRGKPGTSIIKKACSDWIRVSEVKGGVDELAEQEGIEKADASLVILAGEGRDVLVSNDYALIRVARSRGIACYWLTTLILEAVKKKLLEKEKAKEILLSLIEDGMWIGADVYAAILRRIDEL